MNNEHHTLCFLTIRECHLFTWSQPKVTVTVRLLTEHSKLVSIKLVSIVIEQKLIETLSATINGVFNWLQNSYGSQPKIHKWLSLINLTKESPEDKWIFSSVIHWNQLRFKLKTINTSPQFQFKSTLYWKQQKLLLTFNKTMLPCVEWVWKLKVQK